MATRDTGSVYGIYIDNDKQISYNHISMKDESVLPAIMDLVEAGFIEEKEDIWVKNLNHYLIISIILTIL